MKPRSEAQIAASRANGAKSRGPVTPEGKRASAANTSFSTGPRTPEGKARACRNATKHAILAHSLTLPDEEQDEFIELLNTYKERFQAADLLEERAVETMVYADWRRRRIWTFEVALMFYATILQEASHDEIADRHIVEMPQLHSALAFSKLADKGRTLDLVCRYETILRRDYNRALAELKELQKDRREREANQLADMEVSLDDENFITPDVTSEEPEAKRTEPEPLPATADVSTGDSETKRTEPNPDPHLE